MKLITLNLWGGRISKKFDAFFAAHPEVDIWCFQEVFHLKGKKAGTKDMVHIFGLDPDFELLTSLRSRLPGFQSQFCGTFKDSYGIVMYVREGISILEEGEALVATGDREPDLESQDHDRKIQWMKLRQDGKGKKAAKEFLLVNAHLTHRPVGKSDSEKRLLQSQNIIDLLARFDCPKILVGDFNLLPDTESIAMIERTHMTNLIKEHRISSTRTELYKKPWRFADYVFVSPGISVRDFKVLPDVVSDHSPVGVEFEVE